eukprot:CAMPEP_0177749342 /NCGR_PEP_ID=MMETSP0484_2-20121128/32436_1 /TAXON_ID=354590 /ORGANISM="Rhodomonas lens, Strain RHODO" /LENGTH=78 /DNA_ID=CAMNT_0019264321 /DNA_START=3 /DNA_END=235 /DNA_ORIENTATION=+
MSSSKSTFTRLPTCQSRFPAVPSIGGRILSLSNSIHSSSSSDAPTYLTKTFPSSKRRQFTDHQSSSAKASSIAPSRHS